MSGWLDYDYTDTPRFWGQQQITKNLLEEKMYERERIEADIVGD